MRKLTILAALSTVAILSISDSISACWRCRSRGRCHCDRYVQVTRCCPPATSVGATTYPWTYTGTMVPPPAAIEGVCQDYYAVLARDPN